MPKFGDPIDLSNLELQNATEQNLGAAPSSPAKGWHYFDSGLNTPRFYNGTAWINVDATQATGIPPAAFLTSPYARANHTGTQLAATISDFQTQVRSNTLDQFGAPAADVGFNSKKLTNVADPVNPQDVSTKNYTDVNIQAAAAGIQAKIPVAVVAVANIASLSGLPTVDGITLTAGQRILLTAQTTASQNGPYVVAAGAWARPTGDPSPNNELSLGALWYVEQGTVYNGAQFIVSSPVSGAITPGTTAVSIVQFFATSQITNGNGLSKVGNTLAVQPVAGGGVNVTASGVSLDTNVATRKAAGTFGDGSATTFTLTHNLNTLDITVAVRLIATGEQIFIKNNATGLNTCTVGPFGVAPAVNAYRVIVQG